MIWNEERKAEWMVVWHLGIILIVMILLSMLYLYVRTKEDLFSYRTETWKFYNATNRLDPKFEIPPFDMSTVELPDSTGPKKMEGK